MSYYIFALDISLSNTGVAIFNDAGECVELLSIGTHREASHPLKLKKIEKAINALKKRYKPKLIVIEESFSRFNRSTQAIYKVRGVIELIFYNIKQVFYHSTDVRKTLLGKGNTTKEDIHRYLSERFKISFGDYDQSDAYAVGVCYFRNVGVL